MNIVILEDGSIATVVAGIAAIGCAVMAKLFTNNGDIVRGIVKEVL